ncbi:quinone oxidoreductase family protein [Caulobacter segnis]
MKALVQDRLGSPLDVVALRDVPQPIPAPGQALVRMVAVGIHPGDFFYTQGQYPEAKRPSLPGQIVGNHGVGRVVETGGRADLSPGMLVAFSATRLWAEFVTVDPAALVPLSNDYPVERAAQFMPAVTARDLLEASEVQAGQWLAVTAGHSLVSTLLIQMAARRGVKVVAIVRRKVEGRDLTALGATAVIELSALDVPLADAVRDAIGDEILFGVVDAIGGAVLTALLEALGFRGRAVIVGAYDLAPFQTNALRVLMQDQVIRAYIYRYFFDAPSVSDAAWITSVLEELADPSVEVLIAGVRPLEDFRAALEETVRAPENGKQVLVF